MGSTRIWLPPVLLISAVILQSTLLQEIALKGVVPDVSLVLLVFFAYQQGSMSGQVNGFISGIIQDFLSTAPLGLNACVRTVIGLLYGVLKGKVFVDPIFLPMILIVFATIIKAIFIAFLSVVFIADGGGRMIFGSPFWIELGMNAILAPFLFGLLKMFSIFKVRETGGFT